MQVEIIAKARTPFAEKFGVPRQSGLVEEAKGKIIFEPAYRNSDALRGLEEFSHLWLIWVFDRAICKQWSPMVRPPRLGGNTKLGVFATRSPFRPNPIGLSSVKLEKIYVDATDGPILEVSGIDLVDETPILDIKPYIPYCDVHVDASSGFVSKNDDGKVDVQIDPEFLNKIPEEYREGLLGVLSQDPRPRYQNDPERIYGMSYAGLNVTFRIQNRVLCVLGVEKL